MPLGFLLTFVSLLLFVFTIVAILDVSRLLSFTGLTFSDVIRIATANGKSLRQDNGRTNILLLGFGGGVHEGADLTDTIIIFSYAHASGSASLISVPRDTWSETLKDKINSAYHYGEERAVGGGYTMAKTIVNEVTGLPLHYVVSIDFSGFKTVINTIGGIDVSVADAFTDTQYPIAGRENDNCGGDQSYACRYMTVTFVKGNEHMNGDRALSYVRSRHADGPEGTDFARSKRQQEVLSALKSKLIDPRLFLSPESFKKIISSLGLAVNTDLSVSEIGILGKLYGYSQKNQIEKISFEGLLANPPEYLYGGRYVLVPIDGTFRSIHSFLKDKLR